MTQSTHEFEKAAELIEEYSTGMLVTRDETGRIHSRPMIIARVDEDARLWFLTRLETEKVEEVLRSPSVGVTFQRPGAFVAVAGQAEVVTEPAAKKQAIDESGRQWFSQPDDPRAGLLCVVPETIEYWDNRGFNSLKLAFQTLVAKAHGEKPEMDATQHGHVQYPSQADGSPTGS